MAPSSRITLKSGEMLRVDFSASQLKHWRRNRVTVPLKNAKGQTRDLDCSQIKSITSHPTP